MKTYGNGSQLRAGVRRVFAASVVVVGCLSAAAVGQTNGTWTQAGTATPYNWGDAANWAGGTIANGTGGTANFTTPGLTVPMIVNLDVDRTIGNLNFSNPSNSLGWTITGGNLTLATTAGTPTVTVTGPALTATIQSTILGSQGLAVAGTGSLVLTSGNGYSGNTVINGGQLVLDNSFGASNIIPGASTLVFNGGTVSLITAPNQAFTQSVNGTTVNAGAGSISIAPIPTTSNLTVALGTITRNAGGTLHFDAPQSTLVTVTASNVNTNDILGGWATVNLQPINAGQTQTGGSMGWAAITAVGSIVPLALANSGTGAYTANNGAGVLNGGWAAANNVNMAGAGATTVAADSTVNSVRFNNASNAGYAINLQGGTNTIGSGGILVTPNANGNQIPGGTALAINGPGALTSGSGDLIVHQHSPMSALTIAAPITGAIGLAKSGPGTLTLTGANTYTGTTNVNAGTLLAQTTAALPGFNAAGRVRVDAGATLAATVAGATPWTAADLDALRANATFVPGSALGIDVPTGSFTYGSTVGGPIGLTKTGAGTLTLSGANSFTGPATVGGGVLSVASLANSGTNSPLGAGSSIVLQGGGVLQYTGSVTTLNRPVTLGLGGGGIDAGSGLTLSGGVAGSGGLTVTNGSVTLTGPNSYTGQTTVAGQLTFGSAAALPAGADLNVRAGGTVTFGSGVTPTIAALNGSGTVNLGGATTLTLTGDTASGVYRGALGGSVAVVKNGPGLQAFAGANTFTGGITVNAGTLQASPQAAAANPLGTGTVTLAAAGTTLAFRQSLPLATTGYNVDVVWTGVEGPVASRATTAAFSTAENFAFYTADVLPAANLPTVPGGMPPSRTGAVGGNSYVLQPYTANNALKVDVSGGTGTLTLSNPEAFKSIGVLTAAPNGPASFAATLNFVDGTTTTVSGLSALDWFGGANPVVQGVGRYNFGNGTFDAGAPGGPNPRLYQATFNVPAADQAKVVNSITFTDLSGGNTSLNVFGLNGSPTAAPAAVTLGNNVVVSANATLEASGYTTVGMGNLTVGANTLTTNGTAGSTLQFAGTTLTGAPTFTVSTANLVLGLGTVTDNNSGFGLTKNGAGTLSITSGTNYAATGTVAVSAGTLLVSQPSGLPARNTTGAVTVANTATLAVGYGAGPLWQEADVVTLRANATFAAGSLLGFDVPTGSFAYTPTITGTLGVAKSNVGTLTLSGANTYTGVTQVNGGVLSVGTLANGGVASGIGQSANAAANLRLTNGGILQYTGPTVAIDRSFTLAAGLATSGGGFDITQAGTQLTISGVGGGAGPLVKSGPGTLILTGANTYTGGTTINAGTLQVGNGGTTGVLGTGDVTNNGTLVFNRSSNFTAAQSILGAGGVVQLGTGSVTLTGTNTYTGPTTVSSGTLIAGGASAFGQNSAVTTATGATLSLNGNGVTIGSLAGTGGTVNNNAAANATLTVGSNNASTTFGGTIVNGAAGALALTKVGTGTLTLTGANTYSGGTTIADGSLAVSSDAALGTGPVTIGSSFGSLTYTGTTATAGKSFNLGGGTLAAQAGATVTLNGGTVTSGYLGGAGTFATGSAGGVQFANATSLPSVTIASNSPADLFVNFANGGTLNVAAGLASPVTMNAVTNQGSGTINVGAGSKVNASGFQSFGVVNLLPATSPAVTQLTNTGSSPLAFNGGSRTFVGTPATAQQFAAGIDLNGKNAVVAGGLLVNNGFIVDSAAGAPGRVVADFGALVKGAGFYQSPVVTQNGGRFQAGNSPGATNFGEVDLGPGGTSNFGWQINNAMGTAGPSADGSNQVSGWSLLRARAFTVPAVTTGNFTWSATPANKLTFALETLLNPTTVGSDVSGPMANFSPAQAYAWPVVTYEGTYTGPTDPAALVASTTFDVAGFVNPTNGGIFGWNLDQGAKTLSLTFTPVPEPGTMALTAVGGLGLGWLARRRNRRRARAATDA